MLTPNFNKNKTPPPLSKKNERIQRSSKERDSLPTYLTYLDT